MTASSIYRSMEYFAHTSEHGPEPLLDHLMLTAELASRYGVGIKSENLSCLLGLLHDIGKRTKKFQKVLSRDAVKINHAIVGAVVLQNQYYLDSPKPYVSDPFIHSMICSIIAGHHSNLKRLLHYCMDEIYLLPEEGEYDLAYEDGKEIALENEEEYDELVHEIQNTHWFLTLSEQDYLHIPSAEPYSRMLYARMLFSCLVDGDYTATKAFRDNCVQEVLQQQDQMVEPVSMLQKLETYRHSIIQDSDQTLPINQLRNRVYHDAIVAGQKEQGFYTMTAPTGTAKTLALMRFALEQAKTHHLERIFVVLPFLSIISQNVDVYKQAFGENFVLEDDCNTEYKEEAKEMAERWDAPIIVTTSAKFFDTVFTSRSTVSRKLHRLANSCIVFDECQTLPHKLTSCTLLTLQSLIKYFGSTVLFSTATQPCYHYRKSLSQFHPMEVVRNVGMLYRDYDRLKCTELEINRETMDYKDLVAWAYACPKSLFVFNTIKKARSMYQAMIEEKSPESVLYLSSDLCAAHKADIIDQAKESLKQKKECYLVSTQCIEAGVDLNFPSGAREFAPLPSVVQTAGRVNRNGGDPNHPGTFLIFSLQDTSAPGADYKNEADKTKKFTHVYGSDFNLNNLNMMEEYYKELYSGDAQNGQDKPEIISAAKSLDMKRMNEEYQLIDEKGQYIVIVPYINQMELYHTLVNELRAQDWCITKKQMKMCAATRVTRYNSDRYVPMHCQKLYLRGAFGTRTETNWFLAETDDYDKKLGLKRDGDAR